MYFLYIPIYLFVHNLIELAIHSVISFHEIFSCKQDRSMGSLTLINKHKQTNKKLLPVIKVRILWLVLVSIYSLLLPFNLKRSKIHAHFQEIISMMTLLSMNSNPRHGNRIKHDIFPTFVLKDSLFLG